MTPLVDSHCHLDLVEEQDATYPVSTLLNEARAAGVGHMLCVAVDLIGLPRILEIARAQESVFASVGLHPNSAVDTEPTVEELIALADQPKVIAIGESGLDYYRSSGDLEWQRERFRTHIRAANQCGKPLIVHSRDAQADIVRIMREECATGPGARGGVMHCFVDDWATAVAAIDLGFYISFSGIVTFRNAQQVQQVAKQVPLDRLLIETDSPYLAPAPKRGKTNQPAFVRHVAEFLALLRDDTLENIAAATTENFFRLFSLAQRNPPAIGD